MFSQHLVFSLLSSAFYFLPHTMYIVLLNVRLFVRVGRTLFCKGCLITCRSEVVHVEDVGQPYLLFNM